MRLSKELASPHSATSRADAQVEVSKVLIRNVFFFWILVGLARTPDICRTLQRYNFGYEDLKQSLR